MADHPTIETTLGVLVDVEPVLRKIAEQDIPTAKARYHVARLTQLVREATKPWYETRAELFKSLGIERDSRTPLERAEGPTVWEIKAEHTAAFLQQIKDMNTTPVTIAWGPIRSTDIPQARAADCVDLGPLCVLVEPT